MKPWKAILYGAIPIIIALGLLVFAWYNPLYKSASSTLDESVKKSLESLAIMEDLRLITTASASVHIPVISGTFEGASQSLGEATRYLSIASVASLTNAMLLKISHLKVFLAGLLAVLLISFIGKYRPVAQKLLLLGFLINPGLSVFTYGIHWIDEKVQLTDKDHLHTELAQIHTDFTKKEAQRKSKLADRKNKQLERDKKRGRDKLTLLQRVGDGIEKDVGNVGLHLEEDFAITGKTIHFATKKIKVLIVNYFTSTLLLSFLLPIGYLLIGYLVLKSLFPTISTAVSIPTSSQMNKAGIQIPQSIQETTPSSPETNGSTSQKLKS